MRIGIMADTYKPHISGVTNYIDLNKRYLEQAGHQVFVFTFGQEDEPPLDEPNVIRSPGVPLSKTGFYLNVRYTQQARKLLHSMDVVHVQHPFLSGGLALLYCRPRGIPIIFTNHTRYDLYMQAYIPQLPDGVGEAFLRPYMANYCHSVERVIAPSAGLKRVLQNLGVTAPIKVIPNGVDLSPFTQLDAALERSTLNFSRDDIVLIYSGRLGPEKNLPFLLRSFAGAVQAYPHLRLVIIGDGPEHDNLADRVRHMGIADQVFFTGMIPYAQMPQYLAMADIFVTASVTEVHPLSVIEAMGAGLPVLGIDSPGVGDTVQDGENGFLAPDVDLAAFTAKLIRMVTDEDLRAQMAAQARQTAQYYAIENTAELLLQEYQAVLDRHDPARPQTVPEWLQKLISHE